MNIKLDSLRIYLEAMSLSLSLSHKRALTFGVHAAAPPSLTTHVKQVASNGMKRPFLAVAEAPLLDICTSADLTSFLLTTHSTSVELMKLAVALILFPVAVTLASTCQLLMNQFEC